jgi:hypothetical protein
MGKVKVSQTCKLCKRTANCRHTFKSVNINGRSSFDNLIVQEGILLKFILQKQNIKDLHCI